jgi:hypothetical protein
MLADLRAPAQVGLVYRYKKVDVMLLDLVPSSRVEAGLFDLPDDARSKARMKTLDDLPPLWARHPMLRLNRPVARMENTPRSAITPVHYLLGRASCRALTTCLISAQTALEL